MSIESIYFRFQNILGVFKKFSLFILLFCSVFVSNAQSDVREEIIYPGSSDDIYWFIHITDAHIDELLVQNPRRNLEWILNEEDSTIIIRKVTDETLDVG